MKRVSWREAFAVLTLAIAAAGCPGTKSGPDGGSGTDSGTTPQDAGLDNGQIGTIHPAANGAQFQFPFDAVPTSDGTKVFFTAEATGATPGLTVFSTAATGGTPTALTTPGDPFAAPVAIALSSDDNTVYVADPAGAGTPNDQGAIFSVPATGGTPSIVGGTQDYAPRGLVVVSGTTTDTLYFSGTDPANGEAGVFKVSAGGGTASAILEGAPLIDPSGLAVTAGGTVYVLDTDSGSGTAQLFSIASGVATVVLAGLRVGYPAGIALSGDESALLISALDPVARTDEVIRLDLSTGNVTTDSTGIDTFVEPAGLHRSSKAGVYAWADSLANSGGTVFVLSK
jgi:hypothetical protein